MRFFEYVKDQMFSLVLFLFSCFLIVCILIAFKTPYTLNILLLVILFVCYSIVFLFSYYKRKHFYDELFFNIQRLDKSYLVLETIQKPSFLDGKLFCNALYEIDKSMNENVKNYELQVKEFKEYIEMWIHEIKLPIASLILMAHNHKDVYDKKALIQMKKIESYVEQILYYARGENAEKDYLITSHNLEDIIKGIALKNKDYLLENNIDFIVENVNYKVLTDSKWLSFIFDQIIGNSIKYTKEKQDPYIKISGKDYTDKTIIVVEDNGIGIPASDIKNVFDKSFTGSNGRKQKYATGMGLFIAKSLCTKLGHTIEIESVQNEYTRVKLTFIKNKFYDVVK